jgi:hypothetical protein
MAACDVGRMSLFIRSILWDLDIQQEAATIAYEDNDECTAMGNALKPTTRTWHIDIKFFALCNWIERNLIHLERINTSINIANHLTKPLSQILFHWHANFLLGHVPQNTHQYTNMQSPHTGIVSNTTLTISCPIHSQPP